jgi:hypothetical protein
VIYACMLSMAFLMALGILGFNRLDSIVQRPVLLIARVVPMELAQGLTSAILLTTIAVLVYAVFFWFVLTAWDRLRSR